jgi:hypothetical protein
MAFYINRNGRAQQWDRDHNRLELARWVFHHPEILYGLIKALTEAGVDIFHMRPDEVDYDFLFEKIDALTNDEIDDITGVDLDGN